METLILRCLFRTSEKLNLSTLEVINVLLQYVEVNYKKILGEFKATYLKLEQNKIIKTMSDGGMSIDIIRLILAKYDLEKIKGVCGVNKYFRHTVCTRKFWLSYFDTKYTNKEELFTDLIKKKNFYDAALVLQRWGDKISSKILNTTLEDMSRNGHVYMIKELLKDNRVDPSANSNVAIRLASGNGHFEAVKALIEDGRANLGIKHPYWTALGLAIEKFNFNIVDLLLKNGAEVTELAIAQAANNSNTDILKELLKYKKFNIGKKFIHSYLIDNLFSKGYFSSAEELMRSFPELKQKYNKKEALISSIKHGNIKFFKELISKVELDEYNKKKGLMNSVIYGNVKFFKELISKVKLDEYETIVTEAVKNDRYLILKELSKIPQVDFSINNNQAAKNAIKYGHDKSLSVLLRDPRVNSSFTKEKRLDFEKSISNKRIIYPKTLTKKDLPAKVYIRVLETFVDDHGTEYDVEGYEYMILSWNDATNSTGYNKSPHDPIYYYSGGEEGFNIIKRPGKPALLPPE